MISKTNGNIERGQTLERSEGTRDFHNYKIGLMTFPQQTGMFLHWFNSNGILSPSGNSSAFECFGGHVPVPLSAAVSLPFGNSLGNSWSRDCHATVAPLSFSLSLCLRCGKCTSFAGCSAMWKPSAYVCVCVCVVFVLYVCGIAFASVCHASRPIETLMCVSGHVIALRCTQRSPLHGETTRLGGIYAIVWFVAMPFNVDISAWMPAWPRGSGMLIRGFNILIGLSWETGGNWEWFVDR